MKRLPVCLSILLMTVVSLQPAEGDDTFTSKTHGFSIAPPAKNDPARLYQMAIFFLPASDGFAPNVNVQRQLYEKSLEEYDKLSTSQFKALKLEVKKRERNETQLTYEYLGASQGKKMHWHSKAFRRGKYIYLVTGTALESQWESNRKQLIDSVNSFKLEP